MLDFVPELGSTNSALLARLGGSEHPAEGYWLVADRQSSGRGRAGRVWSDGYGNFMGSTVAFVQDGKALPQTLSLVAGLAVHRAVSLFLEADERLHLKWPNDVLLDGAKLAGVLLERHGDHVVVGIGVNIANAPLLPDRATTCLAAQGCSVGRNRFANELAKEWAGLLARWHAGEWPLLREEWLARAHPLGTKLSVRDVHQGTLAGEFAGIGADGTAYLRLADAKLHAIHAGDIEMVRENASGS